MFGLAVDRGSGAVPAFDSWVEALTAEWLRSGSAGGMTPAGASAEPDEADALLLEGQQARQERRLALARKGLAELAQFSASSMSQQQQVSAKVLRWHLERHVGAAPYVDYLFVFRQVRGLHVAVVDGLAERSTLRQRSDVETYLERLGRVRGQIDEGLARARAAVARGLYPPQYIVERAAQQVDMFLDPAADQNVFVTALIRRTADLDGLSPEDRGAAAVRAARLVADEIQPAYRRVQQFLRELEQRVPAERGMTEMPDGVAAYAEALTGFTSTRLSAEEIHALGLREVARLEREMDGLLRQLGFVDGAFAVRLGRAIAGTTLPPEPDPRAVLLAKYNEYVRDAEKRCEGLFNLRPLAPLEVRRVPALTERTASAHYTVPPPDRSRGGVFWVPLPGPAFSLELRMRSLAYHEGVPGHHFQLAIQQENKELPRFRARRSFGGISAHSEGWGLYAERLAVEQGWYEGDPAGKLGALYSELFRARRLVVDTGLHAKRWTRQQAIDYGIPVSEVERYVVNPGQACSYMIGLLRIVDLRERAKVALGPRFSLPAFHDVVLRTGTVPLDVLGEVIDDWIARQRAGSAGSN